MTDLTPQIAAVAAVMDEIDQCRRPMPCDLCRQRMQSILDMGAAAERARIYAELGNDHYVIFTEDRWTIEHSVECRLSGHMHECGHHAAVARITAEFGPDMAGRWRINGIDGDGLPDLVRAGDTS